MTTTLVTLYDDMQTAHQVIDDLIDHRIERDNVGLIAREQVDENYAPYYFETGYRSGTDSTGTIAGNLIEYGLPREDAHMYAEGVRRGGILALALVTDNQADEAIQIMERHDPVNVRERATAWRQEGWTGYAETERTPRAGAASREQDEEVIDVVDEEVRVGKRQVQKGGIRVHKHVREEPVEKTVTLRETYVDIDRRAVDRPATEADFEEKTIEVTQEGEEAVVEKEARVTEQVRVHKETEQHEETVRATERHTEVDVERDDERSRRNR